jgi:hypothetical protein
MFEEKQGDAGLGINVYGFAPEMFISGLHDWDSIHDHDERINIRSILEGTRVFYDVVARFTRSVKRIFYIVYYKWVRFGRPVRSS